MQSCLTLVIAKNPGRKKSVRRLALGVLFVLLLGVSVFYTRAYTYTRVEAAPASTLNFQARLTNVGGAIVSDGSYSVQFKLYAASSGGVSEWTETQSVTVKAGHFSVYLGGSNPFPGTIDWTQEHYLTMNVNGDGEMDPRLKLTAVPYAFAAGKAAQADTLTITGGSITGDGLAQLAPGALQSVNSTVAGLRINQVGSGGLLQLATGGADKFTVSNSGTGNLAGSLTVQGGGLTLGTASQSALVTLNDGAGGTSTISAAASGLLLKSDGTISLGTVDGTGTLLVLDTKSTSGDPAGYNGAMYYNGATNKFRCYQGGQWQDCINGQNYNATASFVSGRNNLTANGNGLTAETLVFTSATGVSNTAGGTGFTAPADGSFRTCTVKNELTQTGGNLYLRWRVNGASVGSAVCNVSAAHNRDGASSIDPGVVTFSAGDVIGVAFDTDASFAPSGTQAYTAYWTVEYNSTLVGGGGGGGTSSLQGAYDNSASTEITLNSTNGGLTILDDATPLAGNLLEVMDATNATTYFGVSSTGVTSANTLTIVTGGVNVTGDSVISGSLSGLSGISLNSGDISSATHLNLTSGGNLGLTSTGDLILTPGSGLLGLNATTIQRIAAGSTTIELNDSTDTVLQLINTDGSAVANLQVEGTVTAAGFSGDGSGLTNISASAITSGTLSSSVLPSNVAFLDALQTFTARQEFNSGLVLGNTSYAAAGAIRWNGTDFEGYNGTDWVSFTSGSGVSALATSFIQVYDNTGGTDLNTTTPTAMPWDSETKKDSGFTHSNVTNNTRIYLDQPGWYKISYNISGINQSASRNNVFCQVRMNGTTYNTPSGTYSYVRDTTNAYGTNSSSIYMQTTSTNEYYEVLCSQAGTAGADLAEAGRSWTIAELTTPAVATGGGAANAFVQNGNDFGAAALLGTASADELRLITNGTGRLSIDGTSGDVSIYNALSIGAGMQITGDIMATTALTISSGGTGTLTLDSASDTLAIAGTDTTLQRIGSGVYTIDLNDAGDTTLVLLNNGGGAASLNIEDGAFQIAGTTVIDNSRQVSNLTGVSSSGAIQFSGLNAGGIIKSDTSGNLSVAIPGTDYEAGLTAGNGLTRSANDFTLGGTLSQATDIGLNSNNLTITASGGSVFTAFAAGGIEVRNDSSSAFVVRGTGGTDYFTVNASGNMVQVGSSTTDSTAVLSVLDSYNGVSDPTGVDGASYYNSSSNKSRCYADGFWSDCSTTRVVGETTLAAASNTISLPLAKSVKSLSCRIDSPGMSTAGTPFLRFNGDTGGASYGWNEYSIIATATTDAQDSSDSEIQLTGNDTSNSPFVASFDVTSIQTVNKPVDWSISVATPVGTNNRIYHGSGTWSNTTSMISSITLATSAGNYLAGTTLSCDGR